jgi:hypothetical protein
MFDNTICEECGAEIEGRVRRRTKFCGDRCRYRHRDRLRYAADPEGERAKSRRYYAANRERVIARVKARQAVRGNALPPALPVA